MQKGFEATGNMLLFAESVSDETIVSYRDIKACVMIR